MLASQGVLCVFGVCGGNPCEVGGLVQDSIAAIHGAPLGDEENAQFTTQWLDMLLGHLPDPVWWDGPLGVNAPLDVDAPPGVDAPLDLEEFADWVEEFEMEAPAFLDSEVDSGFEEDDDGSSLWADSPESMVESLESEEELSAEDEIPEEVGPMEAAPAEEGNINAVGWEGVVDEFLHAVRYDQVSVVCCGVL